MTDKASADTIFALSSGQPPAGVAVIRISGPGALGAVRALAAQEPPPRQLALRTIRSRGGEVIDRGMVVVFPGPASFTGEDSSEIHLHGGRAVVSAVLRELGSMPDLRLAEAGEFSQRAFANGRFDLTAAEALADLIEAETEAQRRFAIDNASGRNAALYRSWRDRLLNTRAMLEADLDFSDEEDVPGSVADGVRQEAVEFLQTIADHIAGFRRSEMIRNGYRVAIVGAPNAGKSSLLNYLAQRDAAIVSDEPGTTRDAIEVALDLEGMKVIITDTAGIREEAGPIERLGIARALDAAGRADLVLLLTDLSVHSGEVVLPASGQRLSVGTKADLLHEDSRETHFDHLISTRTGAGLPELIAEIGRRARDAAGAASDVIPFRERHVADLERARDALAVIERDPHLPTELVAEQLRLASVHLGRLIGEVDVEDILGVIFSRFCIGK